MNYTLEQIVLQIIQIKYPGGLNKFREEDGRLLPLGGSPYVILLYHPNPSEELRSIIDDMNVKSGNTFNVQIVTTKNFRKITVDDFEKNSRLLAEEIIKIDPGLQFAVSIDPVCTIVYLDMADTKKGAEVEKLLRKMPGLIRGAVIYNNNTISLFEQSEQIEALAGATKELAQQTERTERKGISEDDLTNLKILLNSDVSFDEFLKQL